MAAIASTAVIATGLVALDTTTADALTLQNPTITYQDDVNGNYVMVGNGVLEWKRAISGLTTSVTENQLHNGEVGAYYNDYVWMGANTTGAGVTDLIGAGAANGSSATVTIPTGARVVKAQLYWAGNAGSVRSGNTVIGGCSTNGYVNGAWTGTNAPIVPAGSPATRNLMMKIGGGAVQNVAPGTVLTESMTDADLASDGSSNYYSTSTDVTSLFSTITTGSAQTVSVGNLWAVQGGGCFAGWSLALVYDYGQLIPGNADSAGRDIILYSGHVRMNTASPAVDIPFNNFETLDTGSRLGITLYEGDRNITGDTFSYRAGTTGAFTALSNGIGNTDNYGISSSDGSVRYAGTGTGQFFNANVDVRNQALPLPVNATSMQLRVDTSGDSYLWQNAVLSTSSAKIDIKKQALDGTDTQAVNVGGTPSFRITITNNGSVPLGNIAVTDPLAPNCARTVGQAPLPTTLASLASITYTCTGPATTSGWTNTASVTANAQGGSNRAVAASDPSVVTVTRVGLTKSGTVPANATVGQQVTYTFTATNTGSSPLTGVAITDPKPGLSAITYGAWPSGTVGALAPGQSVSASATYTLTQADINAGTVSNTASVAATGPNSTASTATAPATVAITANPLLTLAKTGVLNPAGTAITYSFTATNTGNLPLTGVAITDPQLAAGSIVYDTWPSGTTGTLNPGQSVTATATYPVTQANTNAGVVNNTASVSGTPPRGTPPTTSATAQVTIPRTSGIAVTKAGVLANTGVPPKVGDLITYTFTARNTGNTTLTGVTITDPLPGLSAVSYGAWPSGTPNTLQPGQTVTATATYPLTQSDIDAGAVANTANGAGTSPTGPVTGAASTTVPISRSSSIALTKSGLLGGAGNVNDVITYTFTARNSGNTTLTGVTITDPMSGLSAITYGTWPSGTVGTLAPGQSVTGTATYTLTLGDVNSGAVVNTASTRGTPPAGAAVTASAPATVPIPQGPAITLTKTGTLAGPVQPGSIATFTFTVRNAGNVTLNSVGITDQLSGLSSITFGTWPGATGTLNPGQSVTATATYAITQADIDAGSVRNNATARGTSPRGATVTAPGAATVPLAASPSISVVKDGVLIGSGRVGDSITYSFTVRNTGNVTLHGVTVNDPRVGGGVVLLSTTLAPNATVTGTASYVLTQADVNAGRVDNTATASGLPPTGAAVTATGSKTVPIVSAPAIQVVKTASQSTVSAAGQSITYTFRATNLGNVTLTGVSITDPLSGLSALTFQPWPDGTSGSTGTLQPGQSVTATATYTVTQGDVNAGSIVNLATTSGKPPTGANVSGTDPETVTITPAPALTLVKAGALAGTGVRGDTVNYSFRVTNTGNVTLTGVDVDDPLAGLSDVVFPAAGSWPSGVLGTLQPGQSIIGTASYSLTQADVDLGRVDNTATASGTPPTGPRTTTTDAETVTITPRPSISVVKDGALVGSGRAGDSISYSFTVRNTGNVTLHGVTLTDPRVGGSVSLSSTTLAPNATATGTATYVLTQADVNAGRVDNTATASGLPPIGGAVTGTGSKSVPIVSAPAIQVVKTASPTTASAAGQSITYTFRATNLGNVTLTGVSITDPLSGLSALTFQQWPDGSAGTTGTLQPGQSVTATATYTVTQGDVNAGSIVNLATTSGKPPTGANVTGTDPETVSITRTPGLTLVKSGALAGTGARGDTVNYSFRVTNSGNVTLTGVDVDDPLTGLSDVVFPPASSWPSGVVGTLQPGQTIIGTASYSLTQADVDLGRVDNTATAGGTPPTGPRTTTTDDETVTITPRPSIAVDKTGALTQSATPPKVGDTVTYNFIVTNNGTVTLHDVALSDPKLGGTITLSGTGTLAPGATATATRAYVLTQADIDAGTVANTASATGLSPTGTRANGTDDAVVDLPENPAITVVKTGVLVGGAVAGDQVEYTFVTTNSGTVTLRNVAVRDPLLSSGALPVPPAAWPGVAGTLAPGQSVRTTARYTLTQADIDSGSVVNTASASGTSPKNTLVSGTDGETIPLAADPSIVLVKKGTLGVIGTARAGDPIGYSFEVTNTGNVTLSGVAITDSRVVSIAYNWPGAPGRLAPGATVTATATYLLTQADVDAGSVVNTASVTGTPPGGAAVTDVDSVTVPITPAPAIVLDKSHTVVGAGVPGDVITYSFRVTNTGNVTLHDVGVTDPLVGLTTVTFPLGWTGVLAPNASVTATATYTLTQADVDAAGVDNTATVAGTPPTGPAVRSSDTDRVPVPFEPSIQVVKTGAVGGNIAGSVITYSFTVTNTGGTTLTDVALTDTKLTGPLTLTGWTGATGTLAPREVVTATGTYTLTQADVDAGTVSNTASVTSLDPTGATVDDDDTVVSPIVRAPSIDLDKSGIIVGTGVDGDRVDYSFVVKNDGNVTLTDVDVTDPLSGLSDVVFAGPWPSGTTGTLRPGDQITGTATYRLTQTDVDRGRVDNTATATGTPPSGVAVTHRDTAVVTVAAAPVIQVVKSGVLSGTAGGTVPGDTIAYTFQISNLGNVTLRGVTLADGLPGLGTISYTWPGAPGVLAPSQIATATATYSVSQADIDSGSVINVARVDGTPPSGPGISDTDPETVPLTAAPSLTLDKSSSPAAITAAGQVVTYSFTVKNTGNVTLTSVGVTDPLAGLSSVTFPASWPSGTARTLRPGDVIVGTATYTVTQADVDAGRIVNSARAVGTPPTGGPVDARDTETITIAAAPSMTLDKSSSPAAISAAGQLVTYSFSVKNTGNVTLSGVDVTDPLVGLSDVTFPAVWPGGTAQVLRPGDVIVGTATYTVTQADVDAGTIVNSATAVGTPPTGGPVDARDTETITIAQTPRIDLTKSGALQGAATVGTFVAYSFEIANVGNVTLTGVTLIDLLPGLSGVQFGVWPSGTTGTLRPGDRVTAAGTYALTQADIDAGAVVNSAKASGVSPQNRVVEDPAAATVVIPTGPSISLTKSARLANAAPPAAGDIATFSFLVRNDGNVTLAGVGLTDAMAGLSSIAFGTWPGADNVLAPGDVVTATATYRLTQADIDTGSIANDARATGNPPGGAAAVSDDDAVTVVLAPAPSIEVVKTGSLDDDAVAGDAVTYSFTVTNTGNVTLTGVGLNDPLLGGNVALTGWTGAVGTLAPGASVTATRSYTLTQANVDAGSVANTATATGTPPTGAAVTGADTVTTPLASAPSIAVVKTGALDDDAVEGDTVTYSFTVTNTGNVTLTGVGLDDPRLGGAVTLDRWDGTVGTLAPGETASGTGTYTLTQANVDAGSIANTATATGTPPTGAAVTGDDTVNTPLAPAPELTVVKTGSLDDDAVEGDTVTYSFTVTNTGNVTLTGVGLNDPLLGGAVTLTGWTGAEGVLAPGASVTATRSYTLTQANVDLGRVDNTATATGNPPTGGPVTGADTVSTPLAPTPSIEVVKTGSLDDDAVEGDTVTYSFTVTNTGNVTLTGVGLSDPLLGGNVALTGWTGAVGTLAPGASVTATRSYTLTQANVDAGSVVNTATATGNPPTGGPVTGADTVSTPLASAPSIEVVKTGALADDAVAGDAVTYSFTVTNTGNVTLTGVGLSDPLLGGNVALTGWTGAVGTLAPGASVTATRSYTLTQANVDAGSIANTATATGTPPTGAAVTGADTVTVDLAPAPELTVVKTGSLDDDAVEGDTVTYSFTVTNTGNVTLTGVGLNDPLLGGAVTLDRWDGTVGTLAPGESAAGTGTYTLTQANVDAGSVANTATATGNPPTGRPVTGDDTVTVPLAPAPSIEVVKTGSLDDDAVAGDAVTYSFTVTNTGNVTLTGVGLDDPLLGGAVTLDRWDGTVGTLTPGETASGTGTYTLTQANVDAGSVANTATATGTPPTGAAVTGADTVNTPLAPAPSIEVVKTGSLDDDAVADDTVTYSFTVTNTGNVTLTGVGLNDPLLGGTVTLDRWDGTVGTLAPGQTASGSGIYTLTQADVDSGSLVNTATATGTPPTGSTITGADTVTTDLSPSPSISLVKIGALRDDGVADDFVDFTFTVTNTGNVTLSGIAITDDMAGLSGIVFGAWPAAAGTLAPGESVQATASYRLTQEDVDAGSVTNDASVTGASPRGAVVSADDAETVPMAPAPEITLDKSADYNGDPTVGGLIDYSFTITNTGNVTLANVELTDPLPGISDIVFDTWPGPEGVLAPGQSVTATATYAVTQADADAQGVENTATVTSTPPGCPAPIDGDPVDPACVVQASDSAVVILAFPHSISLVKTGVVAGSGKAGDTVTFTFVATNTGFVTLYAVEITDPLPGLSGISYSAWPESEGMLAPGQQVEATATYQLTQADVDAGTLVNNASAFGLATDRTTVDASDTATVLLAPTPSISLDKTVDRTGSAAVGTTLTYGFTVTNTGNVTLTGVAIADPLPGLSAIVYRGWPGAPGVLAPGASVTATATYVVTSGDAASGTLTNTATVRGSSATGGVATGVDAVTIATVPLPATGGDFTPALPIGAALLILVGLGVYLGARRKEAA